MKKKKKFVRNERGAVFAIIGLSFMCMVGVTASSVDMARGGLLKSELITALDSAGLAGGTVANSPDVNETIHKYFNANMPSNFMGSSVDSLNIQLATDKTTLSLSTSAHMKNSMMQVVGWDMTNVPVSNQITIEHSGLELVMVLDNTGSMTEDAGGGQSKIQALQSAATSLVNILYGDKTTVKNLWIGLVPFAQAVNVGTQHASWTSSNSNDWGNTTWMGCVESRGANTGTTGRDVTDDPPATQLFTQYYSACVNTWSSSASWHNSWYGTTRQSVGGGRYIYENCSKSRGWQYSSPLDTVYGPNQYCSQPLTGMTSDKATILNAINSMQATGDTEINLGLAWGWRMLSPRWRGLWGGEMNTANYNGQTLPLDYNTPLMNKAVILLTDGNNNATSGNYTAYGSSITATNLNSKTTAVCNSLKKNGVIIYTIALGTDLTSSGKSLLQDCASNPAFYFESPTASDLQDAFTAIGDSLSNLRISK